MTGLEISKRIKEKEEKIEQLHKSGTFPLFSEVMQLDAEIEELQKLCPHEFENGECKFCHIGE